MKKPDLLKLNENTETLITEISALSGYGRNVVKEIFEYLIIDWAIKISETPDAFAPLVIPYIGTLDIKYSKDINLPNGDLGTEVEYELNVASNFKKLIGTLHDEAYPEIINMLEKKIEQVVMVASTD